MDTIKAASEYALHINSKIEEGKHTEANDMLMVLSEKLSKECHISYSDAKQTIFFCMGR